ncbi:MAG: four helix bundle protein [Vicinamibacterales bacterium]
MVWKKAHRLTLEIYRLTRRFPDDERYGLRAQIRRCAVSVCANIAEGCGRGSRKDFARLLYFASGSVTELELHLLLSADLGFIERHTHTDLERSAQEVRRMLAGLLRRLED